MAGKQNEVERIYKLMIADLTNSRRSYYRTDLTVNWNLSLALFSKMSVYLKAHFDGVTADSCGKLLMETRKAIVKTQSAPEKAGREAEEARRRYLRRSKRVTGKTDQEINCANPERLTPLESSFYSNLMGLIVCRRLGTIALRNHWGTYYGRCLAARIDPQGITFLFKDKVIRSGKDLPREDPEKFLAFAAIERNLRK